MICTQSGMESTVCTPTRGMYQLGCRCEGAKAANREYMRDYKQRTQCPICLRWTARASGFCARHEKELTELWA